MLTSVYSRKPFLAVLLANWRRDSAPNNNPTAARRIFPLMTRRYENGRHQLHFAVLQLLSRQRQQYV